VRENTLFILSDAGKSISMDLSVLDKENDRQMGSTYEKLKLKQEACYTKLIFCPEYGVDQLFKSLTIAKK
jgi:hypothetical protein